MVKNVNTMLMEVTGGVTVLGDEYPAYNITINRTSIDSNIPATASKLTTNSYLSSTNVSNEVIYKFMKNISSGSTINDQVYYRQLGATKPPGNYDIVVVFLDTDMNPVGYYRANNISIISASN